MLNCKKVIEKDLFNIVKRLKRIDKGYFVVFNFKTKKFEVHNKFQTIDTYALTCPFNRLDSRLIDYVYKTSLRHNAFLLDTLEKDNERLDKDREKRKNDYIETNLKDIYNVVKNSSKTYDLKSGLKTKWM